MPNFLDQLLANPHGLGYAGAAFPTAPQITYDEYGQPHDAQGNKIQPPADPSLSDSLWNVGESPARLATALASGLSPYGSEGWQVPPAIHEPINALMRLAQNSRFEDGHLGIPNPENLDNQNDVLTGLLSMYGGNALNPAAAIPKGSLGIFAGRTAKTADHAALARAEELAAKGAPPREILHNTGWFKGADDQWRFEINDSNAKWNLPRTLEPGQSVNGPMSNALSHPALMDAYPDIANLQTQYVRVAQPPPGSPLGSYRPGQGVVIRDAGEFADPKSTALHELQHHIQTQEGFAPGAVSKDPDYWRSAGEVEARNVQARQNFDPIQRQMTPPWKTQSVPDEQQLVKSPIDAAALLADNGKPSLFGSLLASLYGGNATRGLGAGGAVAARALAKEAPLAHAPPVAPNYYAPEMPSLQHASVPARVVPPSGPHRGYRGLAEPFDPSRNERPMWASSSPDVAADYTGIADTDWSRSNIMPVEFNFSNPLHVSPETAVDWQKIPFEGRYYRTDDLADLAKARGHDGLILENLIDGLATADPSISYAALKRGTVTSPLTGETLFSDTGKPSILGAAVAGAEKNAEWLPPYYNPDSQWSKSDLSKLDDLTAALGPGVDRQTAYAMDQHLRGGFRQTREIQAKVANGETLTPDEQRYIDAVTNSAGTLKSYLRPDGAVPDPRNVMRYTHPPSGNPSLYADLKEGDIFKDPSFMSATTRVDNPASLDPYDAHTVLRMNARTGIDVENSPLINGVTLNRGENEFLVPPNVPFNVRGNTVLPNGVRVIDLEEPTLWANGKPSLWGSALSQDQNEKRKSFFNY